MAPRPSLPSDCGAADTKNDDTGSAANNVSSTIHDAGFEKRAPDAALTANAKSVGLWWRQHLAALLANVSSLGVGVSIGWSAPAQAVLRGEVEGSPLHLTLEERSWVGALVPLGALVAALPAGLVAEHLGRKRGLLFLGAVPACAGWLLMLLAGANLWMLYVGRFLTGLTAGGVTVLVSLYCEEISSVGARGKIGSYFDVFITVGMLWAYVLGALLPYFWFTATSLLPPLLFAITFCWMPESPAYLSARGRDQQVLQALSWLRGPAVDVQPEFESLKAFYKSSSESPAGCWSLPSVDRLTAKAIAIVLGLMFFSQANGINGFVYYITDVFKEAGAALTPETATMVCGVVHTAGTMLPTLAVDRLGRRPFLAGTALAIGLCLVALATYSYLQDRIGMDLSEWRWLPLAALLLFFFLVSAGPGPLTWFMMAELLPAKARGWGSALAVCFSRAMALLVTKQFPPATAALGRDVVYSTFALACFACVVFVWRCVPETRNSTRQQIQDALCQQKGVCCL